MSKYTGDSKVTRRAFLKNLGQASVAVAGAVVSGEAVGAAVERKPRYGMLIDTRKCVGCHACSIACRSENNVPEGKHRSWVEYLEQGTYPDASIHFLPRLCNQCSIPRCTSVCPTDATYERGDGIVVIDPELCIGCKYCIVACPYDVRFFNPHTGVVDKCDFCADRLAEGMEPACVATCFNRARIFGDLKDANSQISQLIAEHSVAVLMPEKETEPNVFYIGIEYANEQDAAAPEHYVRVTRHRGPAETR